MTVNLISELRGMDSRPREGDGLEDPTIKKNSWIGKFPGSS